jgi:plastocyanin
MRKLGFALAVVAILAAVTCSRQPTAPGSTAGGGSNAEISGQGDPGGPTPLTATIQFGQPNVGSPFPPEPPHDQSAHAKDNLVPRNVVIGTGGTVTFNVPPGVHQIAIYEPGTDPDDIDTTLVTTLAAYAGCVGPPVVNAPLVINDPTNRVADYPIPCFAPAQRTHTFSSPGKYLVICAFLPHFEVQMWGWVTVRD